MSQHGVKTISKSEKYKGVTYILSRSKYYYRYQITIKQVRYSGIYETEREAAISYDMKLIDSGQQPRNILKKI